MKKKTKKSDVHAARQGKNELRTIYARVLKLKQSRAEFRVANASDLEDLFTTFVKAAFAKCLDFNVALNSKNVRAPDAFFYASGLRGICEDLIVLRFLSGTNDVDRNHYLRALLSKNLAEGILAQYRFFRANNPLQPLVGAPFPLGRYDHVTVNQEMEMRLREARTELQTIGRASGIGGRLNVADMAKTVGLESTYNFIYFLSSNFVHFNPAGFLKFGWGRDKNKDFDFSVAHMATYYGAMVTFYATLLFIGFASFLGTIDDFSEIDFEKDVAALEKFVAGIHRWPEIVTFEEMNEQPPLFWLTYAMREVMRPEGKIMYGHILEELKAAFVLQRSS